MNSQFDQDFIDKILTYLQLKYSDVLRFECDCFEQNAYFRSYDQKFGMGTHCICREQIRISIYYDPDQIWNHLINREWKHQ